MKGTIKKQKNKPQTWRKIFTKHISDKGLVPKRYKNLKIQQ